ncbi:MAG: MFS transporter, partial [Actinobacteria bacterium]|nr:MFS transporter [Actinomycetota bacterium]
ERRSAEPLVRLSIFHLRTIRSANVVMLLVAAGLFAMFYFNSLYVQRVLGYSPIEAGLAFVPFTLGIVIGAGLSQFLVRAIGLRSVGIAGMSLGAIGMLLFLRLDIGGDYLTDLFPGIMLISIGMGMTFVPVTLIATSGISAGDAGLASGLINTSQQVGGALGLAILSTLATSQTTDSIQALGREPNGVESASALVDGFHIAYIAGAAFLAAGAVLLALMLKRSDVEQIDVEEPATLAA